MMLARSSEPKTTHMLTGFIVYLLILHLTDSRPYETMSRNDVSQIWPFLLQISKSKTYFPHPSNNTKIFSNPPLSMTLSQSHNCGWYDCKNIILQQANKELPKTLFPIVHNSSPIIARIRTQFFDLFKCKYNHSKSMLSIKTSKLDAIRLSWKNFASKTLINNVYLLEKASLYKCQLPVDMPDSN